MYSANGKGFQYYNSSTAIEGIFCGETPSDCTSGYTAVVTGWVNQARSYAWAEGQQWPDKYSTFAEYYEAWRNSVFKSGSKGRSYIDWYDSQVKAGLSYFKEKWGVN
jgi:hypothetical protein